jgi:hypothetical protein
MNVLIRVYTVVFAINRLRFKSLAVYLLVSELIREFIIRAYIVFYSALISVCNAYSYDTRIRTIGVLFRMIP